MFTLPKNPKGKQNKGFAKNGFSSEFVGESPKKETPVRKIITHKLGGILSLGQTIEVSHHQSNLEKQGLRFFEHVSHLQKEQTILLDSRKQELQKAIDKLRQEIGQLIKATKKLDKQVEKTAIEAIPEPSEYQVSFLQRIQNFITSFRKNISEAAIWLETFTTKKKKRNAFWGRVKNKKSGGQQYLFSGEHSASRSAA